MRARPRFHFSGKKIKIRQTWNKYNLYNLARLKDMNTNNLTFYQQKWKAKSLTRSYHGEYIREKQWQRMFTSRIRSVVPMNHKYLAKFDGSEQAEGRGSGKERPFESRRREKSSPATPYMHMTYAPVERRLDQAIFRALFASSARQARQFVTHGKTKVNGKKMIYPGYLLNPGDMFQVDVESVLFATGAPKDATERAATRRFRRRQDPSKEPVEGSDAAEETTSNEGKGAVADGAPIDDEAILELRKAHKASLMDLLQSAKTIITQRKEDLSAKRKQDLRSFTSKVRKIMGEVNRKDVEDLDSEISKLVAQLPLASAPSLKSANLADLPDESEHEEILSFADRTALRDALRQARENPIDPSKPYATPWRSRAYMSPFAFIPRYLEVNQNICSAVYLRHPVVRPGLAEVPTPFSEKISQLAFNWYLRRR